MSALPDFGAVNGAALQALPVLLARWLPNGRKRGRRWHALNPLRADRRIGSFSIDLGTGQWADFATGDKGGDPVSLFAYLRGIRQSEAARELADLLRVKP